MDIDHLLGQPVSVKVTDVVEESVKARTLKFNYPFADVEFHPGQFMMIWIPTVDEVPMSISLWDNRVAGVTVTPIGEATNALFSMGVDQQFGIRGPFGTPFSIATEKALVVGGGIGMAPLRPLTYELLRREVQVTLLIAARKKKELVYLNEFESLSSPNFRLKVSTDDGSMGYKGLATEATEMILTEEGHNNLYTCGPEMMMYRLFHLAKSQRISFQASLERFMKCGCGLCGTCALDPTGDLVCLEGPVFSGEHLSNITEFGKYHRDSMGLKKKY